MRREWNEMKTPAEWKTLFESSAFARQTNYSGPLGPEYNPSGTRLRLWAPTAQKVSVNLYRRGDGGACMGTLPLEQHGQGVWSVYLPGDQHGHYYTFTVEVDGTAYETGDPYARTAGVNGLRSMILDAPRIDPPDWNHDHRVIVPASRRTVWEVSVRDFSQDPACGVRNAWRGKFMAFTQKGTTLSSAGTFPTCLDYLKRLGVGYVQLMPIFDFGSVDESRPLTRQYNWGYDPTNYNVPEGSYSTDPTKGEVRVRECKEMIAALHAAGIGVIMDVVYNHMYRSENPLNSTVPYYFFRQNEDGSLSNGSGCGNEFASERPMARKYLIDSVLYWAQEYHIDGFRFDLMGIHDIETMNEIRKAATAADPTIFIYGEGWAASAPQLPQDSLAMKANTYKMPGIAAFSDEMRDALRGPFNDNHQGAFLAGLPGGEESIKFGIAGAVKHPQVNNEGVNYSKAPWAEQPTQMISYVSCHDDMCLVDRLKASVPGITPEELTRLDKLAQTAVFTSQGVPFIYAGEEVMRDKKGVHNSYQSPDSVNAIDWKRKTEHADVFAYYKGLIQLRKNHPAFRLGDAGLVREHLEFLPVEGSNVVAYRLKGHAGGDTWGNIYVVLNARKETAKVSVPEGKYTVVCKDGFISEQGLGTMYGPEISVPAQSAMIFYQ